MEREWTKKHKEKRNRIEINFHIKINGLHRSAAATIGLKTLQLAELFRKLPCDYYIARKTRIYAGDKLLFN